MKKEATRFFQPLTQNELTELCNVTNETIAAQKHQTTFTAAELWAIQKSKKSRYIRSRIAN